MEPSTSGWGKCRTTYDFICVCGYVVIKDEKKSKERLERLHLSRCEAGKAAKAAGHFVDYWNDATIQESGLKKLKGDSTDGGRRIVPTHSILNNQLK